MGFFSSIAHGIASALPIVGGVSQEESSKQASQREYERQKEFAQNGLRWKVADAKAAGIHPIFAVGANTPTYSPQAAIGNDYGLSQVGQNIGRAIEAGQTRAERAQAFDLQARMGDAQIGLIDAQTDYYRALADRSSPAGIALDEIARQASGSTMALRSQSDQRSKPFPTTRSTDGVHSDDFIEEVTFVRNPKGQLWSLRNTQDFHDMNEDVPIAELVPWINGITWDMRAKLTREPIMVKGKWYAFNDREGYVPINIKTYKPYWKKWFIEKGSQELNRMHNPKTGSRGMRAFFGAQYALFFSHMWNFVFFA